MVIATVLITFRPAVELGFIDYDDFHISETPALREGITAESLRFAFTETPTNLWHPLTWISHSLDFAIFGDWIGGHHLTNVLIHLGGCLLLLAWLRRHTGEIGPSLAVTLLFAIHPLRVESVIWLSERKDVLSSFFYLLTLTFYSARITAPTPARRRTLYLLSLASALLGALSKPSLITLPAALVIIDFWPLRRLAWREALSLRRLASFLPEKIPFVLIALATAVVTWLSWSGNQFIGEAPDHSLSTRASHAAAAYLDFLARTFWPVDLIPFHPYPDPVHPLSLPLALAALTLAATLAIRRRKASPWLCFGLLWFVALIFPVSGIITISDHFAPDRYTYLAHLGLFAALIWEITAQARRLTPSPALTWIPLTILTLLLSAQTTRQCRQWRNPEALWTHTLSVDPENYLAHNQLGLFHLRAGRIDASLASLREAHRLRPDSPVPLANLTLIHLRRGDAESALRHFQLGGPHLPARARLRDQLLALFTRQDRPDLATTLHAHLIAGAPDDARLRLAAGHHHYAIDDHSAALRHYQDAAALAPDDAEIALSLGAMWLKLGNTENALPWLEKSAANPPPQIAPRSHRTLAQAYLLQGRHADAIAAYETALRHHEDAPDLINELAQLLLDCPEESLRDPARALQLITPLEKTARDSRNPRHLRTLARAFSANQKPDQARHFAREGLAAIAEWEKTRPLPAPWTTEEFSALKEWFQNLIEKSDP